MYVGAHVDVYPLTCPALRKAYRRFVYVDGSPGSKYWPPGCRGFDDSVSVASMTQCMLEQGGEYAEMSEFTQLPCGAYGATLDDDSSLVYYFNCPDAIGVPRDVLDDVTALYIHGHAPDASLVDMLPNVSRVYSTSLCVGPAYWAVCKKAGLDGSVAKPWPRLIDECYWDDESDEFVVNMRGCAPRMESDAPAREECQSDSDSSPSATDSGDDTAETVE